MISLLGHFADVSTGINGITSAFNSQYVVSTLAIFLAICLVSTIIIETLFSLLFKVRKRNILIVVLAQIVTNPIVVLASNLINYYVGSKNGGFYLGLIIMEPIAIIAEGLMYKFFFEEYKGINPFLLSLILNLISCAIGILIVLI